MNDWKSLTDKYKLPVTWKSIWQIINSFFPFILSWYLMYRIIEVSYWLTLLVAFPTAGFLVRIFIIQHDCGHGSFFKSKKANDRTGLFCSLFTWTPYFYWRKGHGIHHATAGDLSNRGVGDIYTMTVNEYNSKSRWAKFRYRLYRNPFFLFLFIPSIVFILWYRFPTSRNKALKKVVSSVYWTDIAIIILCGTVILLIGVKTFLMVHLPILFISTAAGQWLFYIQHQFEETYWEGIHEWNYVSAALHGSSFYKLPVVLQWFTGNIGFHHIHHLNPGIPNYLLEKCHKDNPIFQNTVQLTIKNFKNMFLALWDEKQKRLISFYEFKTANNKISGTIV